MNYFHQINPCDYHYYQVFVRPDVALDHQLNKILYKRHNYACPLYDKLCSLVYEDSPFQMFREGSDVMMRVEVDYQVVIIYICGDKIQSVETEYIRNL